MKAIDTLMIGAAALPAAASAASLDDLAWIAGDWRGEGDFQEVWLAPANGFMNGISRLFADGQLVMHEHLAIADEDGELVYTVRKFIRDESGSVAPQPPIVFSVTKMGSNRVLFENLDPQPDAPRRLEYERAGGAMKITVTDPPGAVTDRIERGSAAELVFELQLAAASR